MWYRRLRSPRRRGRAPVPDRIRVVVDAAGADRGPAEVVAGAALAAAEGIAVAVFGPTAGLRARGVELVHCPRAIAKVENPVRAVRSQPEASIVQAAREVGAGRAQALVCAGTTPTAVAASLLAIRRQRGVHRPALALPLPLPGSNRTPVLIDVGANTEARPEQLVQFAFMGAAFARAVLGVARPTVGLLSNGSEPERGGPVVVEAHRRLQERARGGDLPFVFHGNVEGNTLFAGAVDVAVCDGFSGNVALKTAEGVAEGLVGALKGVAKRNPLAAAGGLLLWPAVRALRRAADPELQGGAYLLGLRQVVVVAHGRFSRKGFSVAIARAARAAQERLPALIEEELEASGVARERPLIRKAR